MAKISVLKKVYWESNGRETSGVVRKMFGDHVEVKADKTTYLLHKSVLRLEPQKRDG